MQTHFLKKAIEASGRQCLIEKQFAWHIPCVSFYMINENSPSSFPATRQDLSNLKKTAVDAAVDLGSTAGVHAEKAKSQLKDLASHAQEEGRGQLDQVRVKLTDLGNTFRDYVVDRPLISVGTALAVGFLLGISRRSCTRSN